MDLNDLDLDINNYSLDELLALYNLPKNFSNQDLKDAKKILVSVHPDKSHLPSDYFRFFHKAYLLLEQVNNFITPKLGDINNHLEFEDIQKELDDSAQKKIVEKISKDSGFNIKFNKIFEETYGKSCNDGQGYGEWLNSSEDLGIAFDVAKKKSRELSLRENIDELSSTSSITGYQLENSDANFGKSNYYEDIKYAYTTGTVLGTSESDYDSKKNISLEQLIIKRGTQNTTPIGQVEANNIQSKKIYQDKINGTQTAFRLLQEREKNEQISKSVWGKLFALTKD